MPTVYSDLLRETWSKDFGILFLGEITKKKECCNSLVIFSVLIQRDILCYTRVYHLNRI